MPGGDPATITTSSPFWYRPNPSNALSTCRTIASVLSTGSTMNVSVPHVNDNCDRTSGNGVNASNGNGVCNRANRRTVSPDCVNATNAFASNRSPMSRAAYEITPRLVRGTCVNGGTCVDSFSTASTIRAIVRTVSITYFPTDVSPESITASAPSRTAFATSEASARVGREFSIIDSSICVATITGFAFSRAI
ncbi:hypothetical protein MLGJGCBP_04313 [Rhodococcus sp. T7]|nr:hypothetical protein MLGJGCBP_04313 [Rhodococcus sp. T7]